MDSSETIINYNERKEFKEMNAFNEFCTIRNYTEADKNFIMATFLRGLYYGDSWFSQIPKDIFMDNYKHLVEAMIVQCMINVACLKEDPSVIVGYSILSQDSSAIVWVYVKKDWRNKGIARHLIPQNPIAITHLTKLGKDLLYKFPNTIFNPFYPLTLTKETL